MNVTKSYHPFRFALAFAIIGACVGFYLGGLSRARHPDDRLINLWLATSGLGVLSLLCGYLVGLLYYRRISLTDGMAALLLPGFLFVAGYSQKSGDHFRFRILIFGVLMLISYLVYRMMIWSRRITHSSKSPLLRRWACANRRGARD